MTNAVLLCTIRVCVVFALCGIRILPLASTPGGAYCWIDKKCFIAVWPLVWRNWIKCETIANAQEGHIGGCVMKRHWQTEPVTQGSLQRTGRSQPWVLELWRASLAPASQLTGCSVSSHTPTAVCLHPTSRMKCLEESGCQLQAPLIMVSSGSPVGTSLAA